MDFSLLDWPETVPEAIAMQQRLRQQLRIRDEVGIPKLIAGVDVGYDVASNMAYAIGVLMPMETLIPTAFARAELPATFPYVPGLLSFREIPVLLAMLAKLPQVPDLVMVDGQGIAHPRRLGIAAHLGLITDLPTIGVAKSRLTGSYAEPGDEAGDTSPLIHQGEQIGTVLRSKRRCLPLFISPGHKVGHARAVDMVQHCLRGYRLPEPTRIADKFSKRGLREQLLV